MTIDLSKLVTKARLQFVLNLIAVTIVSSLNTAKTYAEGLVNALAADDIAFTNAAFSQSTNVEEALIELAGKANSDVVTFEVLQNPNAGKLKSYRFTKGTGAGATTMDIDIEKDLLNGTFQLVTITENGGKYYDGTTEVTAAQGVTGVGVYMKYNSNAAGETPAFSYADMSACIEYLTVGTQTGKMVTLSIDPATHTITADIADGTLTEAKLATAVQTKLSHAESAYGWGDHAQAGYALENDFGIITEAECTAAWEDAMTAAQTPAQSGD